MQLRDVFLQDSRFIFVAPNQLAAIVNVQLFVDVDDMKAFDPGWFCEA